MSDSQLGRIYVTGADGFIGSHLVETLVQQGHEVTALCIYNSLGQHGWLETLVQKQPKNLNVLLGDIRDSGFMQDTIKDHQTVLHLAALIAIPYSYVAPQSYIDTNATGTLNVAQACLRNKVKRIVHTSTSEVYGTAQFVPMTEKHPLQGQSPYSASKIAADMVVDSHFRSFHLPSVTLRPFNTYGPRQSLRAVIPTLISQMVTGADVVRLGSMSPTRDFNYVQDTVNAFIAVAKAKESAVLGKTFNAGSGREISISELVNLVEKLVNKKTTVVSEEARVRPSLSEVERLLADSTELRAATDWKPQTTLEDGLIKTIAWFQEQLAGKQIDHQYKI